jgi:hypothetical protein
LEKLDKKPRKLDKKLGKFDKNLEGRAGFPARHGAEALGLRRLCSRLHRLHIMMHAVVVHRAVVMGRAVVHRTMVVGRAVVMMGRAVMMMMMMMVVMMMGGGHVVMGHRLRGGGSRVGGRRGLRVGERRSYGEADRDDGRGQELLNHV